jgi:hypothetical protein
MTVTVSSLAGEDQTAENMEVTPDALEAHFSVAYKNAPGRVEKRIRLRTGHTFIYTDHRISGFDGAYPLGHHATLAGGERDGALEIATKPFDFGLTSDPAPPLFGDGEYISLQPLQRFDSLEDVPTVWKEPTTTSLATFPARRGFVDVATLYRKVDATAPPKDRFAWTCALNRQERWMWLSFKDAAVLPATVLWMENQGRHGVPWNGRNSCIGLEDVCAFSANGRIDSMRENAANRAGVPTAIKLSAGVTRSIRYVQGAVPVPESFGAVEHIEPVDGGILVHHTGGAPLHADLDWEFLFE